MSKDLSEKAIDFKGKKYVLVSDRVIYFNDTYPKGSITTELVSSPEADTVVVKATIKPVEGENRAFTGYSQATWGEGYINQTSALENAETSAVGRALAFMGIGVIESVASMDEIKKTEGPKRQPKLSPAESLAKARSAVEQAGDLEEISKVEKLIRNSPILTPDQKEDLLFKLDERRQEFDPTEN